MPDLDPQTQHLVEMLPSSISLTKNTRGYTWEIKLRGRDGTEEQIIERLKQLDDKMKLTFKE